MEKTGIQARKMEENGHEMTSYDKIGYTGFYSTADTVMVPLRLAIFSSPDTTVPSS